MQPWHPPPSTQPLSRRQTEPSAYQFIVAEAIPAEMRATGKLPDVATLAEAQDLRARIARAQRELAEIRRDIGHEVKLVNTQVARKSHPAGEGASKLRSRQREARAPYVELEQRIDEIGAVLAAGKRVLDEFIARHSTA